MKRHEKYPDTKTFTFYNNNPKNKFTTDCVIRSIALAENMEWKDVLRELTELSVNSGLMLTDKKCYEKYLESKGWKKNKQIKKIDGTKYTGNEFCSLLKDWSNTMVIAHIGGNHIVCIKDGKVHDTWNSTNGCIGNYWTK